MNRRTHYCKDITLDIVGQHVTLCGWVNAIRNKGSIIWIDLRDFSGIAQIMYIRNSHDGERDDLYCKLASLRREYVVQVDGIVHKKPDSALENQKDIELEVVDLFLLSKSKSLPFDINDMKELKEGLSLKFRYLDLRRFKLHQNLLLRNRITILTRAFLEKEGFIEVRTPHLVRPTVGGAKEFLVEAAKGEFFALAQGPQIYMELMVAGGFERCYQISHCICNEGSRHNRQIEFDQLHCEMAFMDEEGVMNLFDSYLHFLYKNLFDKELPMIPRISWHEAMEMYGTESPDIRCEPNSFCPVWITDIPLFKYSATDGKYKIKHHPFTAIHENDYSRLDSGDVYDMCSRSYNLFINGVKVGGSSVRIHNRELQERMFLLSGMTPEDVKGFEHLLNAMDFGMPPHAGMSFGFDRLCAVFGGSTNVKDYMFFPKSSSGKDVMTDAPIRL